MNDVVITERKKREASASHAIASARIEALEVSDEGKAALQRWASGEMSTEDLRAWKAERLVQAHPSASSSRAAGIRA